MVGAAYSVRSIYQELRPSRMSVPKTPRAIVDSFAIVGQSFEAEARFESRARDHEGVNCFPRGSNKRSQGEQRKMTHASTFMKRIGRRATRKASFRARRCALCQMNAASGRAVGSRSSKKESSLASSLANKMSEQMAHCFACREVSQSIIAERAASDV